MRLPALLLFLCACTGKDGTEITDSGGGEQVTDADGDGFPADVDCDDDDASVYPGATETWYDGIDQNCDSEEGDQDADGYDVAEDCDDTDPSVYPDAGEVPDDGIDQDCDGGSDDDQDGDGAAVDDDCDDTDASVSPTAEEVADDGIDQDCDGSDLQSVDAIGASDLLFSEIMNKPGAVDDAYGEYIEVYNATSAALDLYGLVVTRASDSLAFTVDEHVIVPAEGYAVLGRDSDTDINGGVDVDFDYRSDFSLSNDAESLTLTFRSTTFDTVAYDDTAYFPDTTGASMSLDKAHLDADDNDEGQYWCDAADALDGGDLGTPGEKNDACAGMTDSDGDGWVSAWDCDDGSTKVYPDASETAFNGTDEDCDGADGYAKDLSSGKLVISEIMKNPDLVSDADGEWFEVYNNTGYAINLYGLGVGDSTGTLFTVDDDLIVSTGSYVVFAANSDPDNNGGVEDVGWDYPAGDFGLPNSEGEIYLYTGSTKIDSVVYDNGVNFPDPTGASLALKNAKLTSTSNDTGTNWCTSTSSIGGVTGNDLGTPGAKNDC